MKREEIYQALEQLGKLHQQGILSDAEFNEEKQALMSMLRGGSTPSPTTPEETSTEISSPPQALSVSSSDVADIFATGGEPFGAPVVDLSNHTAAPPSNHTATPLSSGIAIPAPQVTSEISSEAADIFMTGGGEVPTMSQPEVHTPSDTAASDAADIFSTGGGEVPSTGPSPSSLAAPTGPLLAERYQVLRELGRGGMGQVLHAKDLQTGKDVALKTLHQTGNAGEMRRRFLQELTLHERLEHPHIVKVQALERDPEVGFFFTMEYVEGQDLDKQLKHARAENRTPPFAPQESLRLLEQIADALDHAHSKGVLHLDLKPANVLLVEEQVKLIDFGIARLRSKGSGQQILGTVYYMAPEQLSGDGEIGAAADLYALGILTYQLLTGKIFQGGMPGPSHFVDALSEDVDDVHNKAVSWQPEARFESAGKFVAALKKAFKAPAGKQASLQHEGRERGAAQEVVLVHANKQHKVEAPLSEEPQKYWPQIKAQMERKRPRWLDLLLSQKAPRWLPATRLTEEQRAALPVYPLPGSMILLSKRQLPLLELCAVQGGEFTVGADKRDKKARRPEKPQQRIKLTTYWLARTTVTNAMWKLFLDESQYEPEGHDRHPDYLSHWRQGAPAAGLEAHPVVNVSLPHVWAFCDFYGLSLPSEAQWEAAARGIDAALYPWGTSPVPEAPEGSKLVMLGLTKLQTHPVESYLEGASPYGMLDMLGNVRQWMVDEYDTQWLRQLKETDPVIQGEDRARFVSLRGCSSMLEPESARAYRRDSEYADACVADIGFRPCFDLHQFPRG